MVGLLRLLAVLIVLLCSVLWREVLDSLCFYFSCWIVVVCSAAYLCRLLGVVWFMFSGGLAQMLGLVWISRLAGLVVISLYVSLGMVFRVVVSRFGLLDCLLVVCGYYLVVY